MVCSIIGSDGREKAGVFLPNGKLFAEHGSKAEAVQWLQSDHWTARLYVRCAIEVGAKKAG